MRTLRMKVLERPPKPRLRLPALRQQSHLPPYTQLFKPQTMHFSSQKNHASRTTRNLRQIVMVPMMWLVQLLELQAVLLAAPRSPGKETIAKRRTGSRCF